MKHKNIKIKVEKKDDKLGFYIKTPVEIEETIKKISKGETGVSKFWVDENGKGVEFYKLGNDNDLNDLPYNYSYFDNFGNGLSIGGKYNVAMLRIKGISKGICVFSDRFSENNNMDLEAFVRAFAEYIKTFYTHKVSNQKITARITLEI